VEKGNGIVVLSRGSKFKMMEPCGWIFAPGLLIKNPALKERFVAINLQLVYIAQGKNVSNIS
jgi:hypothetical protein